MKWFMGLIALGLLASALGQSVLVVRGQSVPVVRLGVAAPLSGERGTTGKTILNGAQLAVLESTARFAKLGLKLELVSFDDQATPAIGLTVARQLAADAAVLGVVGHMNSGVMLEALPAYKSSNLTVISPSSTNPKVTDQGFGFVNRVCGRDDVQGPVAAEFIRNSLKVRRVLVMNDGETYGIGVAQAFTKRAKALGLAVVASITNPIGILSPEALAKVSQQIKLYNPEVIYYGGQETQASVLVKNLQTLKSRAVFVGPDGIDNSQFVASAGAAAKGVYFTSTAGPVLGLRGRDVKGFVQRYTTAFQNPPETYSPYAFDASNMLLAMIATHFEKNKKLPSRAEVSIAVRALEWDGVTGRIRLNANGDRQTADYYVLQYKTAQYPGEVVKAIQSSPPTK
jgi:branched-chain amino acid transport system substrate-binding protein